MYEPAGHVQRDIFQDGQLVPSREVRPAQRFAAQHDGHRQEERARAGEKLWAHLHIINTTAAIALGALACGLRRARAAVRSRAAARG